MIRHLQRLAAMLLVAVMVSTVGLYAFANRERLGDWARSWLAPPVRAAEHHMSIPEAEPLQAPAYRPAAVAEAPLVTEVMESPPVPLAAQEETGVALPLFAPAQLLADLPPETAQAVLVLAQGSVGNLWLAVRQGDRWYNAMGPVPCRVGAAGLDSGGALADGTTPTGWMEPGMLYAQAVTGPLWPTVAVDENDRWGMNPQGPLYNALGAGIEGLDLSLLGPQCLDIGYNPYAEPVLGSGIFLYGGGLEGPTAGSVAISESHMARLMALLEPDLKPRVGILPAEAAAWQVDSGVPDSFLAVSQAVPGARVEARYATAHNFMGRPLDGYQGMEVYVRAQVAAALATVQAALEPQGLGLLIYDGYRPQRAVEDIFRWLRSDETGNRAEFYPQLGKADLPGVYLVENSPHRQGIAVDLTLCDLNTGQPLDMGTEFDFFSPQSWTTYRGLTDAQAANRKALQEAMGAAGFSVYNREWWHFNYTVAIGQTPALDFVIPQ